MCVRDWGGGREWGGVRLFVCGVYRKRKILRIVAIISASTIRTREPSTGLPAIKPSHGGHWSSSSFPGPLSLRGNQEEEKEGKAHSSQHPAHTGQHSRDLTPMPPSEAEFTVSVLQMGKMRQKVTLLKPGYEPQLSGTKACDVLCVVLGMKPRPSHMLGNCSTLELHPQPQILGS